MWMPVLLPGVAASMKRPRRRTASLAPALMVTASAPDGRMPAWTLLMDSLTLMRS